jgi:hypothetical protein
MCSRVSPRPTGSSFSCPLMPSILDVVSLDRFTELRRAHAQREGQFMFLVVGSKGCVRNASSSSLPSRHPSSSLLPLVPPLTSPNVFTPPLRPSSLCSPSRTLPFIASSGEEREAWIALLQRVQQAVAQADPHVLLSAWLLKV